MGKIKKLYSTCCAMPIEDRILGSALICSKCKEITIGMPTIKEAAAIKKSLQDIAIKVCTKMDEEASRLLINWYDHKTTGRVADRDYRKSNVQPWITNLTTQWITS